MEDKRSTFEKLADVHEEMICVFANTTKDEFKKSLEEALSGVNKKLDILEKKLGL